MADPYAIRLDLDDLTPVIDVAHAKLDDQQIRHIGSVCKLKNIRYPQGAPDALQIFEAVFAAAVDGPDDALEKVLQHTLAHGVSKADMEKALREMARRCMHRAANGQQPDLGESIDQLLDAENIVSMERAARAMRENAIGVRRLLVRPILASSFIQFSPSVLDPEQRRRQLANHAVDVVTAVDYFLTFIPSSAADDDGLSLVRDVGPARDHVSSDDGSAVRFAQRRLDARATAVKVGTRLLEGLRADVATL
jgi:hypothetical protein